MYNLQWRICENPLDSKEMLTKVGLESRLYNFPAKSRGEQQKSINCTSSGQNPDILLCDEPTGALDSATGRKVLKLICDTAEVMGKTVIIVTHNALIADMANMVIHMKDGKISGIKNNDQPKDTEEIIW